MKILLICAFLALVDRISSTCSTPQNLYHISGSSIFSGIPDVSLGFQSAFSQNLNDIKLKQGTFLQRNTYTIKNISPKMNYNMQTQVNSIGTNAIYENGGVLTLALEFEFEFVNGLKTGSGTASANFSAPFIINMTKTASFNENTTLKLNWNCQLNKLNIANLTFYRKTGAELDAASLKIFTELLNMSVKDQYVSAVAQIQSRLNDSQTEMTNINNQQVRSLFGNNKQYSFNGLQMVIDEGLTGYALSPIGENIQVIGTPVDQTNCQNIVLYNNNSVNYIGIAQLFITNTWIFLVKQRYLDSQMSQKLWTIPNFSFQIKNFVFVFPKITQFYPLDEQVGGPCVFNNAISPTVNLYQKNKYQAKICIILFDFNQFNGTSFIMETNYTCTLNALLDQSLIMTFDVNTRIGLTPGFDQSNSVMMYVDSAEFVGLNYVPAERLAPIKNTDLIQYFLDSAADSLIDTPVYGSGLFSLGLNTTQPDWEYTSSGMIYFYGNPATQFNSERNSNLQIM